MGYLILVIFIVGLLLLAKKMAMKDKEETKCTCKSCGNVWYYNGKEEREMKAEGIAKVSRNMIRVGEGLQGKTTPWLIPEVNKKDIINKCPKCNSSAIRKETVIHEV